MAKEIVWPLIIYRKYNKLLFILLNDIKNTDNFSGKGNRPFRPCLATALNMIQFMTAQDVTTKCGKCPDSFATIVANVKMLLEIAAMQPYFFVILFGVKLSYPTQSTKWNRVDRDPTKNQYVISQTRLKETCLGTSRGVCCCHY